MVLVLINIDVFEPSYNDLKFGIHGWFISVYDKNHYNIVK